MVPAGDATEAQIDELLEHLEPGDTIIDGGNTNFHDDNWQYGELKEKGVQYVDAGTSGGIWGLQVGYCLMVGGDRQAVEALVPIFTSLAPDGGYLHVGGPGAGHYVKMVHNGIEYGLMQAYAEGFEIMHASDYGLDLGAISELWMQGSVVRSWLLELAGRAFRTNGQDLDRHPGLGRRFGEGRWTVQEAIDRDVPAPIITLSLLTRFRSRQEDSYGAKASPVAQRVRRPRGEDGVGRDGGARRRRPERPRHPGRRTRRRTRRRRRDRPMRRPTSRSPPVRHRVPRKRRGPCASCASRGRPGSPGDRRRPDPRTTCCATGSVSNASRTRRS